MKKCLLSSEAWGPLVNLWLLLFRLFTSIFMLTHGLPKFSRLFAEGELKFADPFGLGPTFTLILVIFAELVCSILIAIGLFTRLATLPLIANMVVATFVIHGDDPFSGKEKALMYLLAYTSILVFGGGKYSLDRKFFN